MYVSDDTFTRVSCASSSSAAAANPTAHTRAQPGMRYRKAEIDNTGGPPAPYPNLDTRPAVAPGPSRRLPFGFCADSAGADATNKSCIMNKRIPARWLFWVVGNNLFFKDIRESRRMELISDKRMASARNVWLDLR